MVKTDLREYLNKEMTKYKAAHPDEYETLQTELIAWNERVMGKMPVGERVLAAISLQSERRSQTQIQFIDKLVAEETAEGFMKLLQGN